MLMEGLLIPVIMLGPVNNYEIYLFIYSFFFHNVFYNKQLET